MSILVAPRRTVKAARRPFGLGILPETSAPVAPVQSADHAAADSAWHLGFSLARDGVEGRPDARMSDAERDAFLDGMTWGEIQRDADMEAEFLLELARMEEAAGTLAAAGMLEEA